MSTYFPRIGGGDPDIYNAYMVQDSFFLRKQGTSASFLFVEKRIGQSGSFFVSTTVLSPMNPGHIFGNTFGKKDVKAGKNM